MATTTGRIVAKDVDISLALPDGLALSTGIIKGKQPNIQILQLRVDGSSGFKSRRTDTYPGLISIIPATNSRIMFEKARLIFMGQCNIILSTGCTPHIMYL